MKIDITKEQIEEIEKNGLGQKLNESVLKIENALNLTKGLIWDISSDNEQFLKEFPECRSFLEGRDYQLGGSCAPVIFRGKKYLISAKHVAQNLSLSFDKSMYCFPSGDALSYTKIINWNDENKEDEDFVLMEIAHDACVEELDCSAIFDLESNLEINGNILDMYFRGCPCNFKGTEIENFVIRQQCFRTNGLEKIRKDCESECYWVKMKTPTDSRFGDDPRGMSGSPVYGINNLCEAGLIGIVIGFNKITKEYQILPAKVICEKCKALLQD